MSTLQPISMNLIAFSKAPELGFFILEGGLDPTGSIRLIKTKLRTKTQKEKEKNNHTFFKCQIKKYGCSHEQQKGKKPYQVINFNTQQTH